MAPVTIPRDPRLAQYKITYKRLGEKMLEKVIDYLHKNIDNYTIYKGSTEYAAYSATGYENDEDSTIFSSIT